MINLDRIPQARIYQVTTEETRKTYVTDPTNESLFYPFPAALAKVHLKKKGGYTQTTYSAASDTIPVDTLVKMFNQQYERPYPGKVESVRVVDRKGLKAFLDDEFRVRVYLIELNNGKMHTCATNDENLLYGEVNFPLALMDASPVTRFSRYENTEGIIPNGHEVGIDHFANLHRHGGWHNNGKVRDLKLVTVDEYLEFLKEVQRKQRQYKDQRDKISSSYSFVREKIDQRRKDLEDQVGKFPEQGNEGANFFF